jgi:hypothetical protein
MSERHVFNFDGGEELTTMGATWFVSYSYHKKIDKNHVDWRYVLWERRASVFERTGKYHKYWLKQVLNMADGNLEKNQMGLSANDVKRMAKELLAKS